MIGNNLPLFALLFIITTTLVGQSHEMLQPDRREFESVRMSGESLPTAPPAQVILSAPAAPATAHDPSGSIELQEFFVPLQLTHFEATDTGRCVLLKWSARSADETPGFHIFRSENATNRFSQINSAIITGIGRHQGLHHYVYEDYGVDKGKCYYYKLMHPGHADEATYHGPLAVTVAPPHVFALEQNYPNPFNPTTNIAFSLPRHGRTSLVVYNINGQPIRTLISRQMPGGRHEIIWDGRDDNGRQAPSGVYFYTLMNEELHKTRRMQLVK